MQKIQTTVQWIAEGEIYLDLGSEELSETDVKDLAKTIQFNAFQKLQGVGKFTP
jgi:hypothetical protein